MPGRTFTSTNQYRYGFNGKENDLETTSGSGGTQDYGFRIYNPALGRFLSVDPLAVKYPMLTPFQFASNTPIQGIDLDGLEVKINKITDLGLDGKTKSVTTYITVELKIADKTNNGNGSMTNEEIANFANPIREQIISSYENTDPKNMVKVTVNITIVKDINPSKELGIEIVDGIIGSEGVVDPSIMGDAQVIGGKF